MKTIMKTITESIMKNSLSLAALSTIALVSSSAVAQQPGAQPAGASVAPAQPQPQPTQPQPQPQPGVNGSVSAQVVGPQPPPQPAQPQPQPQPVYAGVDANADTSAGGDETRWIDRYAPEKNQVELGVYAGVLIPSKMHELYDPQFLHQPYANASFDIGGRAGFYPLRWLGIELGGGGMPTRTADSERANLYTFRAWAIAQAPYRVAPFARVGFGFMGANSFSLGRDNDPAFHFGGGLKFYINRWVGLRLDVVDNITTRVGIGEGRSHHVEVLLGLIVTLNRAKRGRIIDTDHDTLPDPGQDGVSPGREDACPYEPGPVENQGCPWIDTDQDTLYDPGQRGLPPELTDSCPVDWGTVENHGCPYPDSDQDTLFDPNPNIPPAQTDNCWDLWGPVSNQGCPVDSDGDRLFDPFQNLPPKIVDACPNEPGPIEKQGCPGDPPAVRLYNITFANDSFEISPESRKTLDEVVAVLQRYPDTTFEIEGHTSRTGSKAHNDKLSKNRAAEVRGYIIEHGVRPSRLKTSGHGFRDPIPGVDPKDAKQRRIEFHLLSGNAEVIQVLNNVEH